MLFEVVVVVSLFWHGWWLLVSKTFVWICGCRCIVEDYCPCCCCIEGFVCFRVEVSGGGLILLLLSGFFLLLWVLFVCCLEVCSMILWSFGVGRFLWSFGVWCWVIIIVPFSLHCLIVLWFCLGVVGSSLWDDQFDFLFWGFVHKLYGFMFFFFGVIHIDDVHCFYSFHFFSYLCSSWT